MQTSTSFEGKKYSTTLWIVLHLFPFFPQKITREKTAAIVSCWSGQGLQPRERGAAAGGSKVLRQLHNLQGKKALKKKITREKKKTAFALAEAPPTNHFN